MNVSQTLDTLLQQEVRRRYREKWQADNQQAIAAYNERVKQDGVFGDNGPDSIAVFATPVTRKLTSSRRRNRFLPTVSATPGRNGSCIEYDWSDNLVR